MSTPANPAEAFVYQLCCKSFLSLWSYANPIRRAGKELCDVLIVCDPDILIFSVKEITLRDTGDVSVDWARWQRRAIDESYGQIMGAERWIRSAQFVIRSDGSHGLPISPESERRIHRIAVALGGQGKVPISYGDLGKGFVHVFDEISLRAVMAELDTVSDFVRYLIDKEAFLSSENSPQFLGTEEELLATYLSCGRQFPAEADFIITDGTVWDGFTSSDQYKAKKNADAESYSWDRLIEGIVESRHIGPEPSASLTELEIAIRTMARENRFSRRLLGRSLREFLTARIRARMMQAPSGVVYVLASFHRTEDLRFRIASLGTRCFIARGLHPGSSVVVGIGLTDYQPDVGTAIDLVYLQKPEWTQADQSRMEEAQHEFGYFHNPVTQKISEDEYPTK